MAEDRAAESSATMDAKARREARKARILGAGTDRLARITKTGRGGEAELLYGDKPKPQGAIPSSEGTTLAGSIDDDDVLQRANAALSGGSEKDDPHEIDISRPPEFPASSLTATQNQTAEMPQDLQSMMKALQESFSGNTIPSTDPVQQPPLPQDQHTSDPHIVDVVFNLLRALVFVVFGTALVYGAIRTGHAEASESVAEDVSPSTVARFEHMSNVQRWARLAYERPAHWEAHLYDIENFGLPLQGISVLWLFITLEIGLSSMRIMLQRARPQPPGILLKVASYIPNASIQLLLRSLASYLPLLDAFVNDVSIVIFCLGCGILFAAWKSGVSPLSLSTGTSSAFGSASDAAGVQAANILPDSMQEYTGFTPPM